ncbi:hypothetical protein [Rhizobium sp. OAE497]|uniref:hypothetical protein n=1 Tax=Rhizobium sp. OAE497 TaxID=2663796 RepID=UPI001A21170E
MTEAQAIPPGRMRGIGLGGLNTLVFLGVSSSSSIFGGVADFSLSAAVTYGLIFGSTAAALAIALAIYAACRQRAVGAADVAAAVD